MTFPTTDTPRNWGRFLARLTGLKGDWLFRGALEGWSAQPSLERACAQWGIPLDEAPEIERKLLREFKRHHSVNECGIEPDDDLRWLALMQHYGAPTRLLDWTYSPYVATFFAIDALINSQPASGRARGPRAAVWAINCKWLDRRLLKLPKEEVADVKRYQKDRDGKSFRALCMDAVPRRVLVCQVNPMILNERLSIQQGLFLCPGDISKPFLENLERLGDLKDKKHFRSFVLSRGHLQDGFAALHRMNVSARTLYPGLSGYAQSLKHRLRHLASIPDNG